MDTAAVDRLKEEWTGRQVTVAAGSPHLRRFAGKTGTVMTVNMSGRALVRFDATADIGWYDIELTDLVPAPVRVQEVAAGETAAEPASVPARPAAVSTAPNEPPSAPAPTAKRTTSSILEMARRQGAASRG